MPWIWLIPLLIVIVLVLAVFIYRHARLFGHHVQIERTQELFQLQHERLEAQFLQAALASGNPPGLRWRACRFNQEIVFAREKQSGQLAAFVGMEAELEPMEPANGQAAPPGHGAALFYFQRGHWHTSGEAFLNFTPAQVLEQFRPRYEPVVRH